MGYEIHITRAKSWMENAGQEISAEEWMEIVEKDPELSVAGFNGPYFVLWRVKPQDWDGDEWLDWSRGNISSKHPSEALLSKMLELSEVLGARVQGDDLEIYRSGNYNDYYREEQEPPAAPQPRRFAWVYYWPPFKVGGRWWEQLAFYVFQFLSNLRRTLSGK